MAIALDQAMLGLELFDEIGTDGVGGHMRGEKLTPEAIADPTEREEVVREIAVCYAGGIAECRYEEVGVRSLL